MTSILATLSICFVGVAAIVGIVLLGRRPPVLMCSCGHGYGTHAVAGRCNAEIKREKVVGLGLHWEYAPCPCLTYDGPEPRI